MKEKLLRNVLNSENELLIIYIFYHMKTSLNLFQKVQSDIATWFYLQEKHKVLIAPVASHQKNKTVGYWGNF